MKKFLATIAIVSLSVVAASAQVKPTTTKQPGELFRTVVPTGGHARILGNTSRPNQTETRTTAVAAAPATGEEKQNRSTVTLKNPEPIGRTEHAHALATVSPDTRARTTTAPTPPVSGATASATLSQIYRIGAGDVLDVQLVDMPTSKSTLFTVQGGGKLEYPLAGDPLSVVGLTTDEIATRLRASIKVFDHPRVLVRVRDYASHNVAVSGAVANPGTKALRREAVPLYVLLAEAQPQTEASRVTVSRSGQAPINLDLNDQRSAATLVQPGDEIKVFGAPAAPPAYFYISGAVNSTGQKAFHSGLTLTQAIIASGGLSRGASGRAKILRQGADGKLAATEFNLRQIDDGRIVDPALLPGDRIAAP